MSRSMPVPVPTSATSFRTEGDQWYVYLVLRSARRSKWKTHIVGGSLLSLRNGNVPSRDKRFKSTWDSLTWGVGWRQKTASRQKPQFAEGQSLATQNFISCGNDFYITSSHRASPTKEKNEIQSQVEFTTFFINLSIQESMQVFVLFPWHFICGNWGLLTTDLCTMRWFLGSVQGTTKPAFVKEMVKWEQTCALQKITFDQARQFDRPFRPNGTTVFLLAAMGSLRFSLWRLKERKAGNPRRELGGWKMNVCGIKFLPLCSFLHSEVHITNGIVNGSEIEKLQVNGKKKIGLSWVLLRTSLGQTLNLCGPSHAVLFGNEREDWTDILAQGENHVTEFHSHPSQKGTEERVPKKGHKGEMVGILLKRPKKGRTVTENFWSSE